MFEPLDLLVQVESGYNVRPFGPLIELIKQFCLVQPSISMIYTRTLSPHHRTIILVMLDLIGSERGPINSPGHTHGPGLD